MEILSIYVDGYKNISNVRIDLRRTISALIGFNNSGKSNFIQSIIFGFNLMRSEDNIREDLLKSKENVPALEKYNSKIYTFNVEFTHEGERYSYELQADWDSYSIISENITDKNDNFKIELIEVIKSTIIASIYEDNDFEYHNLSSTKQRNIEDDCYLIYKHLRELKESDVDRYEILIDSFLSLFPEILYIRLDYNDTVYYKEKYLDRELPLKLLSSGPQKIFKLFSTLARQKKDKFSLVFFEEIENSIHPILIENLLIALDVLAINTSIIITSHSPYLIQHINLDSVYLAVPANYGKANFRTIKDKKKLLKLASEYDQSTGEFIFNLMLESYHEPERLLEWL
ncbi:MAG: AAA family ATPase [Clostridia bacterium]